MSTQESGYMQQLDGWIDQQVIAPLTMAYEEDDAEEYSEERVEQVRKAIKTKVLESYRNGCKAGAGHVRREFHGGADRNGGREPSYAQAKVR